MGVILMKINLDKKWKYLHFQKEDGLNGWSIGLSDEPSKILRNKLLSIMEINGKIKRDKTFAIVFNAMASDPQLIECSDGLHEAVTLLTPDSTAESNWKFFPVYFNRTVYRQFSRYVRTRKRFSSKHSIMATDMAWMNISQLKLARRLLIELFQVEDTSEIDRLIAFKQDNPAT